MLGLMAGLLLMSTPLIADSLSNKVAQPRIWPSPPAVARVKTEGTISAPEDLGIGPTWFNRIANVLAGGHRGREKLIKPFGVAVDEAGNLCITDTGAKVVWYFDRVRQRSSRWEEIEKVRFVVPVAVAKADGIFYVADSGLGQVVAFDEAGRTRFRLTGLFARPAGLALSADKIYVADSAAHSVLSFNLQGRLLGKFGTRGVGQGQFNYPTHVATDREGRVYVTDAMNSRVQLFDGDGRYLSELGGIGDGSGYFSRPKGVAVDGFGHVYVADALFDNVQVFARDGDFLLDLGSSGSAPGEFWMPAGIAIGRDNRIYIADTYNGRIQVLRYVGQP